MKNRFAHLISPGFVSSLIGIAAISSPANNPFVSILLGVVGIIFGILSLKVSLQEKLERWSAWFGIVLSGISMIWSLVNIHGW